MLSVEDIVTLCSEDVKVELERGREPDGLKGKYDDDSRTVSVYLPHNRSQADIEMTLLHEFYHAKEDIIMERDHAREKLAEKEAERTYRNRPEVVQLIKYLWNLDHRL